MGLDKYKLVTVNSFNLLPPPQHAASLIAKKFNVTRTQTFSYKRIFT